MKKTILLLIISCQIIHAQDWPLKILFYGGITTIAAIPLMDKINVNHPGIHIDDGLYISTGIDPKQAIQKSMDLIYSLNYFDRRFESYIQTETFRKIGYWQISSGINYAFINRKISLLIGPEFGYIKNRNGSYVKEVCSYAMNCKFMLVTNSVNISIISNLERRPDISKDFVYSNYLVLSAKIF